MSYGKEDVNMKLFEIENAIADAVARKAEIDYRLDMEKTRPFDEWNEIYKEQEAVIAEIEDLQAQLDAEEARLDDEYAVEQVRHVVRQHFKATTSTAYERSKGLNHRNKKGNNKWAA